MLGVPQRLALTDAWHAACSVCHSSTSPRWVWLPGSVAPVLSARSDLIHTYIHSYCNHEHIDDRGRLPSQPRVQTCSPFGRVAEIDSREA